MKMKQLKISDYPDLKRFFKRSKYRLCEYSLPLIIVWSNDEYQPYGTIDGDALIAGAEFTTCKENRHLLLPISPSREYTPEELRDLAIDLGFQDFWCVPEDYIETYGKRQIKTYFTVTRQKGYDDYIYLTEDLINLTGNKYSKKRNLIHQFEKRYLNKETIEEEWITPAVVPECIDFLEAWCEARHCDVDQELDLACEKAAAVNALESIDLLDVKGLLLRINGTVSAFAIASKLRDDMGVLHFEKAFNKTKGLYQYFDNLCAKRLLKEFKYINKESDMEVPGLTKAKKSYHPVMMVKSYKLSLK